MKLEIVLNEEKAKEHHYNIHKGYAKIEDFMIKQGFSKISEGVLEGDDSQKSFDSVLLINRELAKTKWFPLLVEKWWWHIDGEIEDCMGYITGVWEKKEEKPQIMRMEIVLSEEKAKLHGIDVNKGYKAIDEASWFFLPLRSHRDCKHQEDHSSAYQEKSPYISWQP